MVVRRAVAVGDRQLQALRRVAGRSGTALIGSVFADQHLALQSMMPRREPDRIAVAIAPGERFDRGVGELRAESRTQNRAVAYAVMAGALKRMNRRPWALLAEFGIPARFNPAARVKHVVAQNDVLAGNVLLIRATAVVAPHDAAVRGGALRPVDPAILEGELLGG